jgi:hypothetical protein
MDTAWFAVDVDGKIGRFESSEDGAVPNAAASGGGTDSPSFDVFLLEAACAARILPERDERRKDFTIDSRAVVAIEPTSRDGKADYRTAPHTTALLSDAVVIRESPRLVATKKLAAKDLVALASHPDVRDIWTEDDLWTLLDDVDRGLYDFGHVDHGDPGSYSRERVPQKPLRCDELPASIREHVRALTLPIHFDQTESFHLADHLAEADCATYGEMPLRGAGPLPQVAPARAPARRPIDWWRIAIVLLAVLGIAWLLSRK